MYLNRRVFVMVVPFRKGFYCKGENLLLIVSTPFFQNDLDIQESKQEVTKCVSLVKKTENLPNVSVPLNTALNVPCGILFSEQTWSCTSVSGN